MSKKIGTEELAGRLGVKAGTIRRGYCVDGHYMGLKPIKLPNRRLLWREEEANKLTSGEAVAQ